MLTWLVWSSRPLSCVNTAYPFASAVLLTGGLPWWLVVLGTVFFLVPYNPVSYTHLDVYKRQAQNSLVSTSAPLLGTTGPGGRRRPLPFAAQQQPQRGQQQYTCLLYTSRCV